jgi:hypothetical protein
MKYDSSLSWYEFILTEIKIKNKRVASPLSPELFGDNTTKQDGELEINNANFTISAVLENTNIFAFC